MGRTFQKLNIAGGWLVFIITLMVYFSTLEPTVSLWDCGEYISTAFKLQVGHPPGAPLFQMLGRVFSLFSLGHADKVAVSINAMSALASAFTVMFLFWTITLLARRMFLKYLELDTRQQSWLILSMGFVGSLAYAFTDSFWFSAVEGEVYALSSLFTSIVFWAALRWEADEADIQRSHWLLLVIFLIGLSIGVHLLNLLTIPAIVLIYYFRRWHPTIGGTLAALGVGFGLIALIMYGIIPLTVQTFAIAELLAVNKLGLPFNYGTLFFAVVLIGWIIVGLLYAHQGRKAWMILFGLLTVVVASFVIIEAVWYRDWISVGVRTVVWILLSICLWLLTRRRHYLQLALLSLAFLLIGYSSFLMIVIRANANPPINENAPTDALGLLAYLNREQYGDWPVLYGPNYNSEIISYADGKPVYMKNRLTGRYLVKDARKASVPVYNPTHLGIFPRMWSRNQSHIEEYRYWSGLTAAPENYHPRLADRFRFFINYQLSHMYWRYFMWNFSGRQNDRQGLADQADGNWITGLPFIDRQLVGDMDKLPEHLKSKACNRYFLLPLLLGVLGLLYHYHRDPEGWLVVALLFFMTGIAIVLFLNQYSPQPRERDYSYVASFYAFSIWLGMGVGFVFHQLKKLLHPRLALITAFVLSLIVPTLLLAENYDDHNRSGRYTVRQMAKAYLDSCAPNAILFTHGDNDTFPLWYLQEVEGYRTDVRVCNLSLLGLDWYISQMKRKAYDSDPLPFALPFSQYRTGLRDFTYLLSPDTLDVDTLSFEEIFEELSLDPSAYLLQPEDESTGAFTSDVFSLEVDKQAVLASDLGKNLKKEEIAEKMVFKVPGGFLDKAGLMVFDLLVHNHWKRPVYFGPEASPEAYYGLDRYFRVDGMLYRLVPAQPDTLPGHYQVLDLERNFDFVMHTDALQMNNPVIFYSDDMRRSVFVHRSASVATTRQLIEERQYAKGIQVCQRSLENFPAPILPYDYYSVQMAGLLLKAGDTVSSLRLSRDITQQCKQALEYYFSLPVGLAHRYENDIQINLGLLNFLSKSLEDGFVDDRQEENPDEVFNYYLQLYYDRFFKADDL
ncbi:MAG: DUF2723 domain-containing protein [Bacteroidales bacterium]